MTTEPPVTFRGGIWAGIVPLGVFIAITLALVVAGAPTTEGMIVAAMTGISLGMVFAHSYAIYSERVFSLMANRVAAVAIVCWMWAGAFSGILAASGLVETIVWVGWKLGLEGAAFTVVVFLSACSFAVFVGTGLGTIVGFTAVMYPAGVLLGADPAALMGAILSGAAFGDNLAPISDTTIVSAATQETDVPGVVKSRLKYVLVAGAIAAALFYAVGDSSVSVDSTAATNAILEETADPNGLPMIIPPLLVFVVAVSGFHFLAALTAGIVAAILIGPVFGIFSLSDIFRVGATANGDAVVEGAFVSGAMGLVPIGILTLLLVTSIGLMGESGFLTAMMEWLEKRFARTVRGAEAVIVAMIAFANLCVSVNTVAMITAGPLANELRKRHNIHPYRSANLLDTISCSFPYLLPYAAVIPAAVAMQQTVAQQYDVPVIPWAGIASHGFYQLTLFPLMLLAVATGFGRRAG